MINREPIPWRGARAIEKLLVIILPVIAAAVVALTFMDASILRRLARGTTMRSIIGWLANGNNAWYVAAACLLLLVIVLVLIRQRLVHDKRLWFSTGCPECKEKELIRIKRQFGDRFYGMIGVPAYRYACRNCTYRGLRIARREHTPEREMEMVEAMLRFSPDGLTNVEIPQRVSTDETAPEHLVEQLDEVIEDQLETAQEAQPPLDDEVYGDDWLFEPEGHDDSHDDLPDPLIVIEDALANDAAAEILENNKMPTAEIAINAPDDALVESSGEPPTTNLVVSESELVELAAGEDLPAHEPEDKGLSAEISTGADLLSEQMNGENKLDVATDQGEPAEISHRYTILEVGDGWPYKPRRRHTEF